MITNEQIEQFMAQAHRVGDANLTICSSGNISWRIGDEVFFTKGKSFNLSPFHR